LDSSEDSLKPQAKYSQSKTKKSALATDGSIFEERPFAPFVSGTLEVEANSRFSGGAVAYNEKSNIIIACPEKRTVQFYDATILLPLERIKTEQLDSQVEVMSFWPETETLR